jgi:4-hydroxybutyrate CoA-transferase
MKGDAASTLAGVLKRARSSPDASLTIVPTAYCATPSTLLAALATAADNQRGVVDQLEAGFLLDGATVADAVRSGRLKYRTWHPHGVTRALVEEGHAEYIRLRASAVAARLAGRVDVALVRVSPPDRNGWCSLGPSGSITRPLIDAARFVVAEIDPRAPRLRGPAAQVHRHELDHIVDAEIAPAWPTPKAPDAAMMKAAHHVAALLPPQAAVQLGIGTLPQAVGHVLATSDRGDIRLMGMASRAAVEMLRIGVLRRSPDTIRVTEILGESDVVEYFDTHPALSLHSSITMHDADWLGRTPNLISVCTGLQIDETGSVALERVGGRVISGIGGSVDFIEGAGRSAGGLSVIVMTAMAASQVSRLVTRLEKPAVTISGRLVDIVVTEYGVADLRGCRSEERADRLRAVFVSSA